MPLQIRIRQMPQLGPIQKRRPWKSERQVQQCPRRWWWGSATLVIHYSHDQKESTYAASGTTVLDLHVVCRDDRPQTR